MTGVHVGISYKRIQESIQAMGVQKPAGWWRAARCGGYIERFALTSSPQFGRSFDQPASESGDRVCLNGGLELKRRRSKNRFNPWMPNHQLESGRVPRSDGCPDSGFKVLDRDSRPNCQVPKADFTQRKSKGKSQRLIQFSRGAISRPWEEERKIASLWGGTLTCPIQTMDVQE